MNEQALIHQTNPTPEHVDIITPKETQNQVVIKRYQNRKLYNTETSQYLTLDEIASLIKDGRDVIVFDNKTKQDITSKTLITYCCDQELKNSEPDSSNLKNIIKNFNGKWSEALKG
jgi:polyhydroxyalkanoate synthesis repressor PhaR